MTKKDVPSDEGKSKDTRPRVAYRGVAKLGDREVMCAVLEDGRRGYVQHSLRQAIGMTTNIRVPAFAAFCGEIAPSALKFMGKSGSCFEVTMPQGGIGIWVEAGILTEIAAGVVEAQLDGKLRANRQHLVKPCMQIVKALGALGEVALIDEVTGYQYHRAPDALQDLLSRLIRQKYKDWELRFHPDYYGALCKLFKFSYGGKHRSLPPIIGQITMRMVYETTFPPEILIEVKKRKKSEKLHQWLEAEGEKLIDDKIKAVTWIAKSSVDYRDFEAKCSNILTRPGQISIMFPQGAA